MPDTWLAVPGARYSVFFLVTTLIAAFIVRPTHAQTDPSVAGSPVRIVGSNDDGFFMQPKWAPAGLTLAFSSSGYRGIWIYDAEKEAVSQVTNDPAAGFGFSWSQNGDAILTRVAKFDGLRRLNGIKYFDLVSGDENLILDFGTEPIGLPTWLTNDSQAAVYQQARLSILDIPGRVAKTSSAPDPVVLATDDRIIRTSIAAPNDPSPVTEEDGFVLNLTRSPDGRQVAYEVLGAGLFVMDLDGRERVSLGLGNRPAWSPDGSWIVFQRSEDDGHEVTASDLFAVSVNGSEIIQLTATSDALEMNPSWSADGRFIAFDDRGSIYLLPMAYE